MLPYEINDETYFEYPGVQYLICGNSEDFVEKTIGDVDVFITTSHPTPTSAIGDYLVAMVLTKVITGKLPKQDFLKAYDFTIPGESWFPVNESVEDEVVTIPQNVADIIRRHI